MEIPDIKFNLLKSDGIPESTIKIFEHGQFIHSKLSGVDADLFARRMADAWVAATTVAVIAEQGEEK